MTHELHARTAGRGLDREHVRMDEFVRGERREFGERGIRIMHLGGRERDRVAQQSRGMPRHEAHIGRTMADRIGEQMLERVHVRPPATRRWRGRLARGR
jgi:hypothetical protein